MRREPAQNLVREEQVRKHRAQRIQQRQVREQEVEIRTADTHLAAEFTARFLGGLLGTDSARDESAVETFFEHLGRYEEVVHHALLDGEFRIKFTANGVEGTVAANQHIEHALEFLDFGFQIPVGTFATAQSGTALIRKNQVTAGATDFLVLKRNHQLAHYIREKHRVRIAEKQDVVLRNFMQAVEHGRLTRILGSLDERNPLVGVTRNNLGSLVGRAVIANQHFELFFGVVQLQDILNLAFNHGLFVKGRNQNRHRREFHVALFGRLAALENFAHERERQREKQVAMHQQQEQSPKSNLYVKKELFAHLEIHSFSFSRNWRNIYCNSCGDMESVTVKMLMPLGATSTNAGSAWSSHTSK